MPTIFIPNAGFEDELLASSGVREIIDEKKEEVADRYREAIRQSAYDQGDLHDSITTDSEATGDGYVGRVLATDFKAGWIETGTSRRAPGGHLRRAVESAGLSFEETA